MSACFPFTLLLELHGGSSVIASQQPLNPLLLEGNV